MSVTVNGKYYSDSELEAMSLPELKSLALAEGEEIQARQTAEAQAADAEHKSEIKSEAQRLGETALAERMPLPALEKIVMEQGAEEERQLRQREIREQLAQDKLEKETEHMTLEQIREKVVEEQAKAEIAASPEGRAEQSVRDLEAETRDLQFVHDQLQQKTSKELDAIVSRKVNEAQAKAQAAAKMGADFAASHPEINWTGAAGQANCKQFLEFLSDLPANPDTLELAATVLKQRGLLHLVSEKDQRREQAEPPRRKSSSVSSSGSRSFYDKPAMPSEDEMYQLPLDELRRRADAQMAGQSGADPQRTARTANLSNFGLPM